MCSLRPELFLTVHSYFCLQNLSSADPKTGKIDQDLTCEEYAKWERANAEVDEAFEELMRREKWQKVNLFAEVNERSLSSLTRIWKFDPLTMPLVPSLSARNAVSRQLSSLVVNL